MLKRELKINRNSLLLWSGILIFLFIIVFLVYPSIMENNASFDEMLKSLPQEMLKAFNMDISSIDNAYGWFKTEGFTILILIGGLYSSILGSTILVKEENDKTIEFLYSKPIKRNNIINAKVICGLIYIFLLTFIVMVVNLIGMYISDVLELKEFIIISLLPLLSNYSLFFISMFLSTFLTKTKKSMSMSIAIVFISYFIQIISNMSSSLEKFKCFSVFELSASRQLIVDGIVSIPRIIIAIVMCVILYFLIRTIYGRKELV